MCSESRNHWLLLSSIFWILPEITHQTGLLLPSVATHLASGSPHLISLKQSYTICIWFCYSAAQTFQQFPRSVARGPQHSRTPYFLSKRPGLLQVYRHDDLAYRSLYLLSISQNKLSTILQTNLLIFPLPCFPMTYPVLFSISAQGSLS